MGILSILKICVGGGFVRAKAFPQKMDNLPFILEPFPRKCKLVGKLIYLATSTFLASKFYIIFKYERKNFNMYWVSKK